MDAVITYVNGEDKFWREEYNKHVKSPIEEARYRDWGTLQYVIKGIREFMPFIEHIYLVVSTPSQIENIDTSEVSVVYHKDIIPEKYLPCFNSCTIEMFLHKIPGLSEEFIYFNDDMFILKPVNESDFFVDGLPVLNPKLQKCSQFDNLGIYAQQCKNSTDLIRTKFVKKYPSNVYINQEHIMRPMLKSTYEIVWRSCEQDIIKSLTRIRHKRNYNVYLFNNYNVMTRKYVQKEITNKYIRTSDLLENIVNDITSNNFDVICINDNSDINYKNKYLILNAFEKLFSNVQIIRPQEKPKQIVPEKTLHVALCAIAKNENLYLKEWVDWYKKLGIEKIYLYDNNEIDGEKFEDVINDYIQTGFVEVIDARGKQKYQLPAYIDFYNNYSKQYDWCCFFDVDEFLTLTEDKNIIDYLNRKDFAEFDSIAINWKNYGDNDLIGNENNYERNCLTRFTVPLNNPIGKYSNNVFKKIIRGGLKQITKIESPHTFSPWLDKNVCNNAGERINGKTFKCNCNYNLAYLKHFCTKTILEYILKSKRGGGVNGLTTQYSNIDNFFIYNKDTKEKREIISKYSSDSNTINLLVVNYNTPKLIDILVKNIKLQVKSKYHLYVFDNSDKFDCYTTTDKNITVFDNTKGQIINFDTWLKQFPDRLNCWAKNNGWGSAKHCYSVEKCFDLINDNFILLDSDILLKKDISELYKNDLFYVGEVYQLKTQKLPRIQPYICFINVKLCKLYGIHYFYPEYMHGLSQEAHDYDTGGAFYKFVNKYQHLNIKYNDYITHFGQGSWGAVANKSILKKDLTIDDWLNEYKYLYTENDTDMLKEQVLNFTHKFNKSINIDNPVTIQDKINWLKVYDCCKLKGDCADKIKIHEYVTKKLGKDVCIPIIKVYDSPDDINLSELPDKFVLKCNHGYNMNIICKDKSTFDLETAKEKCKEWLNTDFGKDSLQLQYSYIDRKCFVEEYMSDDGQTESLYDYKFWCFNGEPKLYTINNGHGHGDILYFDMNRKPFDPYLLFVGKDLDTLFEQPNNFELMRIYAKVLSSEFKFVRVDFYEINNTVYVGELTFTPGNGIFNYKDKKYNNIIGNMLTI